MELLTERQLADKLHLKASTVRRWSREGRIPSVKLGGQVLYPVAGLQEWLNRAAIEQLTAGVSADRNKLARLCNLYCDADSLLSCFRHLNTPHTKPNRSAEEDATQLAFGIKNGLRDILLNECDLIRREEDERAASHCCDTRACSAMPTAHSDRPGEKSKLWSMWQGFLAMIWVVKMIQFIPSLFR